MEPWDLYLESKVDGHMHKNKVSLHFQLGELNAVGGTV